MSQARFKKNESAVIFKTGHWAVNAIASLNFEAYKIKLSCPVSQSKLVPSAIK